MSDALSGAGALPAVAAQAAILFHGIGCFRSDCGSRFIHERMEPKPRRLLSGCFSAAMSSCQPSPSSRTVLLVEDHPVLREMLARLIRLHTGMTVCAEADNVHDAMQMVEAHRPGMAIVDLSLKGLSGLELIKNVKLRQIPLPILVLSMHAEEVYAERVLRAGGRGYISKQEPPSEIVAAIRRVAEGGVYVSDTINRAILQRVGGLHAQNSELDCLSDREVEVFHLFGLGLNAREISARINLGISSVDSYRARIREKLGIRNAAELYQRAVKWVTEHGL